MAHLRAKDKKFVSAVTLHELYKLTLEREGRDVAKLRVSLIEKEFVVIPVDGELATVSAEIRSKYRVPMADSMIAASAKLNKLKCVTDDAHISEVDEIETVWL